MDKQKWIEAASARGFSEFEIYQLLNEERKFSWYEGNMNTYVVSHVLGTSFRGIYEGRMVNASSEDTSDEQMEDILSSMQMQAQMINSEDKVRLRTPQPFVPVKETELQRTDADTVCRLLKTVEEKLLAYDERLFQVTDLEYEEIRTKRSIVNSRGLDVCDQSAAAVLIAGAAAKENDEVRTAFKIEALKRPQDFECDTFVDELAQDVLGKLGAQIPESGTYSVIIEKDAMRQLLSAFTYMFSGEQVRKGISPLSGSLGKKVFSDQLNIIDDPADPQTVMPCAFDDEGCPVYRKSVVKDGVLETVLHSTKTADAMGTESTGNGFRASYDSPVDVSAKNFCILPGSRSLEEMMEEMQNGIVITDLAGLHAGIDHVSGDFSLQCGGYMVENGKKAYGLTLMTAAANFIDLLNRIEEIGSDLKWNIHSTAAPSIRFTSIAISGR